MDRVKNSKKRLVAQCLENLGIDEEHPDYDATIDSLKDKKIYELYGYYNQLKNAPRVRSLMSSVLKNIHAS